MIDVDLPTAPSTSPLARGFAACLASVTEVPVTELPLPAGDLHQALGAWRTWLAERGSGLVPVADPAQALQVAQSVVHAQVVPAAVEVDWTGDGAGGGTLSVLLEGREDGVAGRVRTTRALLGPDAVESAEAPAGGAAYPWDLHATGDDEVAGPAEHGLGREVHGLLGGAALAVDRRARDLLGQPGRQPGRPGDVAGLRADGVDAAEDDVLDGTRVDAAAVDEGAEDVRAEVGRVDAREAGALAGDGCADGLDDVGLSHVSSLGLCGTRGSLPRRRRTDRHR